MKDIFPAEFIVEINHLLGDQSSQFWDAISNAAPVKGFRINTLKTTRDHLNKLLSLKLSQIPWTKDGYQRGDDQNLGKHPLYPSGLFYLQEPSAMAPVEIMDPQPGEMVIDLCGAPGGKTTQILSKMKNQGIVIANDPNPRRAQALTRNIERWGARNITITCESPKRLAEHFGSLFDRVLADVPCSGEGTFRTSRSEIKKWSPGFSDRCAKIQDEILWFAGKLVRPGGFLIYSTCTFNQLENEGSIKRFLQANPEFSIEPIALQSGYSPGIPLAKDDEYKLINAIRIWPHLAPGEGHFIAKLKKSTKTKSSKMVSIQKHIPLHNNMERAYQHFFQTSLKTTPRTESISPKSSLLTCSGNRLYALTEDSISVEGLNNLHTGWWIGTIRGDQFFPSYALALGLTKEDAQIVLEFSVDDSNLKSYLRGSSINLQQELGNNQHWALITVEGYPLGWGKIGQKRLKSQIPNWLRTS